MGTILTDYGDAAYDHEGYTAHVLVDGTVTGTSSPETRARMTGELAPACGCGWVGATRWRVPGDDPTTFPDDDLDDEITAVWRDAHAVPVLTVAADKARTGLAARLRGLADQVAAGWPAERVAVELDDIRAGLVALPLAEERTR